MLTLGFVTGVEPDRWLRKYTEFTDHGGLDAHSMRDPVAALHDGRCDVALVRLPDSRVDERFHVVELYTEAPGVAVPKDSVFAEFGTKLSAAIPAAELSDEIVNYRIPTSGFVDVDEVADALQIVAANVGIAIAPRPLLKALSRKQVVPLGLNDPTVALTRIAVVFAKQRDADDIQDFIGIVRGRTAQSSRQAAPKKSAAEKAAAKQARRAAAGKKPQPRRGSRARTQGHTRRKKR
ncbi:LysR family transcriptional regulator substrate-binding protein [Corynebacterium uterequi]|uniref:LysR family regulator n=1 Tax=Corynebacterium uterequi TaxID=1072256 RepID=A0A0G3HDK9_9CORY|nr:LysR family transcriptional regulator substrate-binding protein [Corynebacterium uterequi]AKK10785.1 LysR family regulator [Corynebacterium uterequi]